MNVHDSRLQERSRQTGNEKNSWWSHLESSQTILILSLEQMQVQLQHIVIGRRNCKWGFYSEGLRISVSCSMMYKSLVFLFVFISASLLFFLPQKHQILVFSIFSRGLVGECGQQKSAWKADLKGCMVEERYIQVCQRYKEID